ncbi:GNAT family N-acetyltransferase [Cognatiyoonia sp. IB215182]|nr:GNAT family N-acetyltransferase [Cognatiyoonia sp. IB215182]
MRQLGREQSDDAYSWLPEAVLQNRVLVSVNSSEIQGVAIFSASETIWTIEQVAVKPSLKGHGIGRTLIHRVEHDAKSAGAHKLELDTAEVMTDLLRFYEKLGFTINRRGLPEHGRDNFIRVYMEKAI